MNSIRRQSHFGCLLLAALAAALAATACGDPAATEFGNVHIALEGSSRGSTYELADASFDVEGVVETTLSTAETTGPLSAPLPVGAYTVALRDGWRLLELGEAASREVAATLVSDNPAAFEVRAGEVTRVDFVFQTGDATVDFGQGKLAVGISIEKLVPHDVAFTELMKNPVVLSDADGEWLELLNSGSEPASLQGCRVERDGSGFTIASALNVPSGGSVVLASSDAPGFTPDYVYSGLTLPNTGAFELTLTCGEVLFDTLLVDPTAVPNAAGASLGLDPSRIGSAANDEALAWCNGKDSYDGDFGTPGTANPSCPEQG